MSSAATSATPAPASTGVTRPAFLGRFGAVVMIVVAAFAFIGFANHFHWFGWGEAKTSPATPRAETPAEKAEREAAEARAAAKREGDFNKAMAEGREAAAKSPPDYDKAAEAFNRALGVKSGDPDVAAALEAVLQAKAVQAKAEADAAAETERRVKAEAAERLRKEREFQAQLKAFQAPLSVIEGSTNYSHRWEVTVPKGTEWPTSDWLRGPDYARLPDGTPSQRHWIKVVWEIVGEPGTAKVLVLPQAPADPAMAGKWIEVQKLRNPDGSERYTEVPVKQHIYRFQAPVDQEVKLVISAIFVLGPP